MEPGGRAVFLFILTEAIGMVSLLVVIYISFISLGLPDSLLGSAWPIMQGSLSAPLAAAGYLSMTIQAGTILSSFLSYRLITRFGTGRVTLVSVAMTAAALFGFSLSPSLWTLFICAIPLGLGAGSVDAALNNFVANHYESKHMNWLHCFWGIGATAGPAVMSLTLTLRGADGWRAGYKTIALIQFALVLLLAVTLPLWKKVMSVDGRGDAPADEALSSRQILRLPLIKNALAAFIFFSATEATAGLWSASYLVSSRGISAVAAAGAAGGFYGAITVGRLISGFLSVKISSPRLIRAGQLVCTAGILLMIPPLPAIFSVAGILLLGLGTAPVYPSMLHETPRRFGAGASQAVMGLQMAFAYIGGTCFPPVFGALASVIGTSFFPFFMLVCVLGMLAFSERLERDLIRRERGARR